MNAHGSVVGERYMKQNCENMPSKYEGTLGETEEKSKWQHHYEGINSLSLVSNHSWSDLFFHSFPDFKNESDPGLSLYSF